MITPGPLKDKEKNCAVFFLITDDFGAEGKHESGDLQDGLGKGNFLEDINFGSICRLQEYGEGERGSLVTQNVISFKQYLVHRCS